MSHIYKYNFVTLPCFSVVSNENENLPRFYLSELFVSFLDENILYLDGVNFILFFFENHMLFLCSRTFQIVFQ